MSRHDPKFSTKALALANLYEYVEPDLNSGCWLWSGQVTRQGYGVIDACAEGRKRHFSHRLSFEKAKGRQPTQMVLHSCDTPACINPNHLREGSARENSRDASVRKRLVPPKNRPGWGLRDEEMRERIWALFDLGLSRAAIHAKTGHSAVTIRKVLRECRA